MLELTRNSLLLPNTIVFHFKFCQLFPMETGNAYCRVELISRSTGGFSSLLSSTGVASNLKFMATIWKSMIRLNSGLNKWCRNCHDSPVSYLISNFKHSGFDQEKT